jgi:16S rRNA (cytosine1402-N4)-methyltransferase
MPYTHIPVMLTEAVEFLNCRPGRIYVDGTLGGAGHSGEILRRIGPDGLLIGIDQDLDAVNNAVRVLAPFGSCFRPVHGNFADLKEILQDMGVPAVDGILLDLGLSFHQLENSGRGFSFNKDEPLDMRMDIGSKVTAADIIHSRKPSELEAIFRNYGEERRARSLAKRIDRERKKGRIRSSRQLADIIAGDFAAASRQRQRIHPATRVFMALRIAVNQELERLEAFMAGADELLNTGGRICVIAFHSLEDRIVKNSFRYFEKACICPTDLPRCTCGKKKTVRILTRKVLKPTKEEVEANPLSRSARLRVAEKI